jgi:hypothetical protein
MNLHSAFDKKQTSVAAANRSGQHNAPGIVDHRPIAAIQRKWQAMGHQAAIQKMAKPPEEEEEIIQGKFETVQRQPNRTGLPDQLKAGLENTSKMSMDDVKVHYNSPKPAPLQAHAYTQGTDIHVAPGQEKHLAHEAWHVVQQKQGRVQPTMSLNGQKINDNPGLEREADIMGAKLG